MPGRDGPTGRKGRSGSIGETGPSGQQGIQGLPGVPGEKGPIGPKGQSGDCGENGDNGNPGQQGEQGTPGSKGETGSIGNPGLRGEQGDRGQVGDSGEKGYPGLPGSQGEDGDNGVDGVVAASQGSAGVPGLRGEQGSSTLDFVQTLTGAGMLLDDYLPLQKQGVCANRCSPIPVFSPTQEPVTQDLVTQEKVIVKNKNLDIVFIIEASDNMVVAEWDDIVSFCEKVINLAIHQKYSVKNVVVIARFMKTNSYLQRFLESKLSELDHKLQGLSASTHLYQEYFESFIEARKHVMTDVYPYLRQNSKKALISVTDYMYREGKDFENIDGSIETTIEIMNSFDVMIAIGVGPAVEEENLVMDVSHGSKLFIENGEKYQTMLAAEFEDLVREDFAVTLFEKIDTEATEPVA